MDRLASVGISCTNRASVRADVQANTLPAFQFCVPSERLSDELLLLAAPTPAGLTTLEKGNRGQTFVAASGSTWQILAFSQSDAAAVGALLH